MSSLYVHSNKKFSFEAKFAVDGEYETSNDADSLVHKWRV